MRIAFLFNYPLVDNTPWKQDLIRSLAGEHELFVIFGKTRPQDYLKTYLRKRLEETIRAQGGGGASAGPKRLVRTTKVLTELRIPTVRVANINDARSRDALSDFRPDFVVTALDQLVSRQLIGAMPIGLNAHYGILPEVKGWNATEWSLLEHGRLSVSLHRIAWPVDSGEIYLSQDIAVTPTDDLGTLRAKCQDAAVDLYLKFFSESQRYLSNAVQNVAGRTYYFMNRRLKSSLVQRIQAGEMSRG
jgi:folate-dependent phosphoribosylglycinamide formyltransferase PurN